MTHLRYWYCMKKKFECTRIEKITIYSLKGVGISGIPCPSPRQIFRDGNQVSRCAVSFIGNYIRFFMQVSME